jgi:hypothetical protein
MTAAAARRRPSSRAQLALKTESITTPGVLHPHDEVERQTEER